MHELSLATSALDLALARANAAGARRILAVHVRIGIISGVDPEAFRFAFDAIKAGTAAAEATLHIETPAATAHCGACDAEFVLAGDFIAICPACGQIASVTHGGRELDLARVDLAAEPPA